MENKSHALIAGAFVLIVSALLVAMAVWLTRDKSEHRYYELSSREAITGLQPQAPVRFKGVNIGKVVAISFDPLTRGNVLIRIATDNMAPVSRSTFATLGFQGVTGLAFIQLDDSGESKEALVSTDDDPGRIPMRPSLFSKLSDQGTSILVQVEETSRRLNQLLAAENQKILFGTIQGFGQTAKSIDLAAGNMAQAAASIQRFSNNADKTLDAQFGPEKMNLPKLVNEMGDTLKTLQATGKSVQTTADEATALTRDLKQVSQNLVKPGGVIDKLGDGMQTLTNVGQSLYTGTLPRVNRTSDETARAARQVSRTIGGVSDNPQALIFGNGPPLPGPGEAGFAAPSQPAAAVVNKP